MRKMYIREIENRNNSINNLKFKRNGKFNERIEGRSLCGRDYRAGSVVIELAEKYSGKFGKKKIATGEVKAVDAATEN